MIFIFGLLLIIINRLIVGFDNILWIVDISSFFSILYIIFTAKHAVWGLVFDLLASSILAVANYIQHLWLNLTVCVLICIPNLTAGIFNWKKNERIDNSKNLKHFSKKNLFFVFLVYFLVSIIFSVILYFLKGNLFYLDALYSAGCAIGVILSSFAFIDQFYIYIVADVFGLTMYSMLTIQNINNITMIFTSFIFIIGDIIGLINWKRLINNRGY